MEQFIPLKQKQNYQIAPIVEKEREHPLLDRKLMAIKFAIEEREDRLKNLFSLEKYPQVEGEILQKKKELYQFEDPQIVHRRVELRLALKKLHNDVSMASTSLQKQRLFQQIEESSAELQELMATEDVGSKQELVRMKSNRLRTNWANNVFSEMQELCDFFSAEKRLRSLGFDHLSMLVVVLTNRFRELLKWESQSMTNDYERKIDFINNEMEQLGEVFITILQKAKKEVFIPEHLGSYQSENILSLEELDSDEKFSFVREVLRDHKVESLLKLFESNVDFLSRQNLSDDFLLKYCFGFLALSKILKNKNE